MAKFQSLMSPFRLGTLELANRVVLPALTRARAAEDGTPTEIMAKYYADRADGNLLVSEGTCISKQGHGWHYAPGIYTDEQVEAWKPIVEAVHQKGGKFALQLWHLGRQMHSDVSGQPIVSASAVPQEGKVSARDGEKKDAEVPVELTEEEVAAVVEDYGKAAENAMKAGFDMVEVHGANGYLIDQFCQSKTNKRTDKYGGSVENRLRFLNEIADRLLKSIPAEKIGWRISPNGVFGDMGSPDNNETFTQAVKDLAKRNIGYIHIMDGLGFGFHQLSDPFTLADVRRLINEASSTTAVMGNVGYTPETADAAIASGDADLIAIGRLYISNPDFVKRIEKGIPLADSAPPETWWKHSDGEKGYNDWPTAVAVEE